ncbi:MAG TPA: ABC transporter ATP-binding protein [Longimicrobiales bacterium]
MSASDVVVSLQRLTRRFRETVAVDALSFDINRGELFGIVGPDGAGKTTTLRMLSGVLPPTTGDARLLDHSVRKSPERVKREIAYMSQRFGLYEDLTVRENIMFYADLYRVPRSERPARLERLYQFSNLAEFEQRLAGRLSGGMKQKLSLCCALIHHPAILLLDEPTFGVDPISRRDLWLILHEMVVEGITVIVTTSYLDEAERCDRVAMLHRGKLLALDTPEALQQRLAGHMLAVRAEPLYAARNALQQHPAIATAALFGETLHVVLRERGTEASVRAALRDTRIDSIEPVDPSLEDVFINLVTAQSP